MSDTETARIVKTPEVLHGQPRIDGTRIGVFMLGERGETHACSITVTAHLVSDGTRPGLPEGLERGEEILVLVLRDEPARLGVGRIVRHGCRLCVESHESIYGWVIV